jgi:hypothetical protein
VASAMASTSRDRSMRKRSRRWCAVIGMAATIAPFILPPVLPTTTKVVPVYSHVMTHSAQHRDAAQTEPEPARRKTRLAMAIQLGPRQN